jgi:glycosyltransferase involved in cell wall biosynthesis
VSAPLASDHPGLSNGYLASLKDLRADLEVEEEVVFLADALGQSLEMETVAELYQVTDALLFPSTQEGFGLPILEAGAMRVPVVLSDIPIFREVGADDASFFGLHDPPESIAERILAALAGPSSQLYRRVLREYRWEAIVNHKILPLLR